MAWLLQMTESKKAGAGGSGLGLGGGPDDVSHGSKRPAEGEAEGAPQSKKAKTKSAKPRLCGFLRFKGPNYLNDSDYKSRCKEPVAGKSDVCEKHKCSIKSCKRAIRSGDVLCDGTDENDNDCECPACRGEVPYNLCREHGCRILGCHELRWPASDFCRTHLLSKYKSKPERLFAEAMIKNRAECKAAGKRSTLADNMRLEQQASFC